MRKPKTNSGIWKYLTAAGVLDGGSEEAIKRAKRSYLKNYLFEYKKRQRKEKPEFTINLSKDNGEFGTVVSAAKKHSLPVSLFLKMATLAYINQHYIVPDRLQLAKLEQLLAQTLNEVQFITRTKERYSWEREQKYEAIEKRIIKLEMEIKEVLCNPPLQTDYDSKNKVAQKVLP